MIVPAPSRPTGWRCRRGRIPQHADGMLAGWKFSNFKDGVFAEYFHVNQADANLALLPPDVDRSRP